MNDMVRPSSLFNAAAQAPGPSAVLGTIHNPPPEISQLPSGTTLPGVVVGGDGKGHVLVRTELGILAVATKAQLAVDSQVVLQIRSSGAQLHVLQMHSEASAPASQAQTAGLPGTQAAGSAAQAAQAAQADGQAQSAQPAHSAPSDQLTLGQTVKAVLQTPAPAPAAPPGSGAQSAETLPPGSQLQLRILGIETPTVQGAALADVLQASPLRQAQAAPSLPGQPQPPGGTPAPPQAAAAPGGAAPAGPASSAGGAPASPANTLTSTSGQVLRLANIQPQSGAAGSAGSASLSNGSPAPAQPGNATGTLAGTVSAGGAPVGGAPAGGAPVGGAPVGGAPAGGTPAQASTALQAASQPNPGPGQAPPPGGAPTAPASVAAAQAVSPAQVQGGAPGGRGAPPGPASSAAVQPAAAVQVQGVTSNAAAPPQASGPGAAIPSHVSPAPSLELSPGSTRFVGTVTGTTHAGQPVLSTPLGTMTLEVRTTLPPGTWVRAELPPGALAAAGAARSAEAPVSLGTLGHSWPALEEALRALVELGGPAAGSAALPSAVQQAIPQPGSQLTSTILFFLSALSGGKIADWLGSQAVQTLKDAGREALLGRLGQDFGQMGRLAEGASGDWRLFFIPLLDGDLVQQLRFFVRHGPPERGHQGEEGEEDSTRFILEVELSRLGDMQLDGLVRGKRFDLILRTRTPLPGEMRQDITQIFTDANEATGYSGKIGFQASSDWQFMPIRDDGGAESSLVV